MKVLLINPLLPKESSMYTPEKLPPLGLAYIAAVLEKEGINVRILDNALLERPLSFIVDEIKKLRPEIVGITCTSMAYTECIRIAKAVKKELPSTWIVTGGPHPTLLPESMLKHKEIDFVVLGEGEYTFRNLVLRVLENENVKNIKGLMYKENGRTISTGIRPFIENLDELPFPARHLLPMKSYPRLSKYLDVEPVDSINTSRGCPYGCTFCSVKSIWGRRYRCFSPKRVLDEIEHLVNTYGTKGIYFREDNFTVQKKRVTEICDEIKRRDLDIEWVCESRVDSISRALLRTMREAGCRAMWFGVESGSQRILDIIKKGITIEDTKKAFKLCKEEGIRRGASFMIGIPGETLKEMEMTLKLAQKLDTDWQGIGIFMAIPKSELYTEILSAKLYDRIDENYIAYVESEDFNYEMMKKIRKNFLRQFYLNPKRIIRTIQRHHWKEFPNLAREAFEQLILGKTRI